MFHFLFFCSQLYDKYTTPIYWLFYSLQTLNRDMPMIHNHFVSRRCYTIPLSNILMVPLITTSYRGGLGRKKQILILSMFFNY